ncbi:MAG: leucyl aminopeptidase [Rhodoferax sp.]
MNFELKHLDLIGAADEKADVLVLLLPKDYKGGKDGLSTLIAAALKSGDLETSAGKTLSMYRPLQVAATRLVLAVTDGSARNTRSAVLAALSAAKSPQLKKLLVCFAAPASEDAVRAVVLAIADGSYTFTTTKSKPQPRTLAKASIGVVNVSDVSPSFERAVAIVAGVECAKEWANLPANHATPQHLGQAALALAKHPRISCEVLGPKEVAKLGMGAFMAVAQGSDQPLRFIVLRYNGASKNKAPSVLVGKGITFDSGGISIKPAAEMDEMKFDMSGAASVLGTFKTLSLLKPAVNVVGLIPACENLINGRAVKPGDVVTSMSGQTIEILNTDAEGRLVLCDALTYAERFKPAAVVDIATLTGACVVALGAVRSGMFSPNDALAASLASAGERAHDLCWRMPLDDDYAEGLKSHFADVANIGGRAGGAITAAKFLQRFTDKFPWAHLDIAGSAWKSGPAKGATGRPVGLLVEFLLAQAAQK